MKLLALDTSTEACSAALYLDGAISQRLRVAPREHASLILPMLEDLLAEAGVSVRQLDALAFGRGPGSFTGVRIGTGVAQGIAFAADLPVVPVSSLAAIAQGMARDHGASAVLSAIDARMSEVYWGVYQAGEDGIMQATQDESVCAPASVPLPEAGTWQAAGTGWDSYGEVMGEAAARRGIELGAIEGARLPSSGDIAILAAHAFRQGEYVDAAHALPVYLRDEVAWKPSS